MYVTVTEYAQYKKSILVVSIKLASAMTLNEILHVE